MPTGSSKWLYENSSVTELREKEIAKMELDKTSRITVFYAHVSKCAVLI
jgi:hypothetical protein